MKERFRMSKKSVLKPANKCHICGLGISAAFVSPGHHLFGTVDHVIPLSRGGVNELSNRRAAHNLCNRFKASRLMHEIPMDQIYSIQGNVWALHAQAGIVIPKSVLHEKRRAMRWDRFDGFSEDLMRWADDGGRERGVV